MQSVIKFLVYRRVYFLFDYIRCQFTGEFVYGFVSPEELTLFYAIITGVIMYLVIALFGLSLFALNRITHRFLLETKLHNLVGREKSI